MSPLWTAEELVAATGGRMQGEWSCTGVSIDTRSLTPGELFVALKDQRDGHDFVAAAVDAGAAGALVSYRPQGVDENAPLLIVPDVLEGLRALARAARARTKARVIAVTGSVGKTSSKDMLRTALAPQGRVHAAAKSFNNHWGVPLTLARMPRETDYAVIEIGMNAPGEIAPLSRLARPHVGLITTVAAVHLDAFGVIEGIAAEKASLAEGVEPGGRMILPRDVETFPILAQAAEACGLDVSAFGEHAEADARLLDVQPGLEATVARAQLGPDQLLYKIAAPGRHLAQNALGVLSAVAAAGADVPMAAIALARWTATDGRGARWRVVLGAGGIDGEVGLIDESYNANPVAMDAAFEIFALAKPEDGQGRVSRGRRIAFLVDMLELGDQAAEMHADLARIPSLSSVDLIHTAGPLMHHLHEALPPRQRGEWHQTTEALAARVRRLVDAGDVVMCKGSNGSRARLLVEAIKALGRVEPWGREE